MARFLYFLLMLFLARLLLRAVAEWLQSSSKQRVGDSGRAAPGPGPVHGGTMVRDPICGRHVPQSRALVESRSGQPVYFCSDDCRSAFLRSDA